MDFIYNHIFLSHTYFKHNPVTSSRFFNTPRSLKIKQAQIQNFLVFNYITSNTIKQQNKIKNSMEERTHNVCNTSFTASTSAKDKYHSNSISNRVLLEVDMTAVILHWKCNSWCSPNQSYSTNTILWVECKAKIITNELLDWNHQVILHRADRNVPFVKELEMDRIKLERQDRRCSQSWKITSMLSTCSAPTLTNHRQLLFL